MVHYGLKLIKASTQTKYFDKNKQGQKHNNEMTKLSSDMKFPTMWYVQPVKAQTSLRIRAD